MGLSGIGHILGRTLRLDSRQTDGLRKLEESRAVWKQGGAKEQRNASETHPRHGGRRILVFCLPQGSFRGIRWAGFLWPRATQALQTAELSSPCSKTTEKATTQIRQRNRHIVANSAMDDTKGATASAADPASSDPRFSTGLGGTSPGVLQPFLRLWRTPGGQPASIMSTRGTRNRPCSARRCFVNFEWAAEAANGAHHQHQRGSEGGWGAWPCSRLLPALPLEFTLRRLSHTKKPNEHLAAGGMKQAAQRKKQTLEEATRSSQNRRHNQKERHGYLEATNQQKARCENRGHRAGGPQDPRTSKPNAWCKALRRKRHPGAIVKRAHTAEYSARAHRKGCNPHPGWSGRVKSSRDNNAAMCEARSVSNTFKNSHETTLYSGSLFLARMHGVKLCVARGIQEPS